MCNFKLKKKITLKSSLPQEYFNFVVEFIGQFGKIAWLRFLFKGNQIIEKNIINNECTDVTINCFSKTISWYDAQNIIHDNPKKKV